MNAHNENLQNSLRCLQHPFSLISITLLLLNDHIFKVISPSWLTGKLSDFAGLFFFPFIVAAGLGLISDTLKASTRRIGFIAFGSVGIFFLLLKTSPIVNVITIDIVSRLVNGRVQFILDWTDCIGLTMLWPAWKLWHQPIQFELSKRSYVALGVGLLASLATSPALPPFDTVTALSYNDGIVYAKDGDSGYFAESLDVGQSWEWIHPTNNERDELESLLQGHELPVQACDPLRQQICYRIEGDDEVLISSNSGKSWKTAWEVPPERHDFVLRVSGKITTHDLIIFQQSDSVYLFVAMGNNGILRKQLPTGEWERIEVEEAQPTQFSAPNLATATHIARKEILIWVGIAFVTLLFSHIAIWKRLPGEKTVSGLINWLFVSVLLALALVLFEAVIGFVAFLLLIAGSLIMPFPSTTLIDTLSTMAVAVAVIVPFIWLLRRTDKWMTASGETANLKIVAICVFIVLGVLLIGALPWPLWALGIIQRYLSALTISIAVSVLITVIGYYLIYKSK